jgi:hypothetical protein
MESNNVNTGVFILFVNNSMKHKSSLSAAPKSMGMSTQDIHLARNPLWE